MSPVYWGIVLGLAALVADLFLCVAILYSHPKDSPFLQRSGIEKGTGGYRQAA